MAVLQSGTLKHTKPQSHHHHINADTQFLQALPVTQPTVSNKELNITVEMNVDQ